MNNLQPLPLRLREHLIVCDFFRDPSHRRCQLIRTGAIARNKSESITDYFPQAAVSGQGIALGRRVLATADLPLADLSGSLTKRSRRSLHITSCIRKQRQHSESQGIS